MGLVSGIVVYLLIWWTAIFCVLPWGVKPHQDSGIGTAGSAPENPMLLKKFIATSLLAAVIWLVVYGLMEAGAIDFLGISKQMMSEDS